MATEKFSEHTHYDEAEEKALRASSIPAAIMASDATRFDSLEDASVFFARELDYIKARSYDVIYPELTALQTFPTSSEADPGAETITYYSYDKTGFAKIISNYSTDLPRADVNGKPTTALIKSLGASYGYSAQEMRASRMANKSLDRRKAEAAHYQIDRLINAIAWKGDQESGLWGVLSPEQNIPLYPIEPGKESGGTKWADKTPDEILDDITGMVSAVSKLTKNVERPDTLVLPSDVYIEIASRRIPNTQAMTILDFIKQHQPYIKNVVSAAELNADNVDNNPYASETEGEGAGVALLYTNSPDKLSIEIPMPYYQYPLQIRNLETVIPCEARVAGVIVYYPFSAMIAVGIS